MTAPRYFAIVPAAGRSRRMGRPKLMLEWAGKPILEHVLGAWQRSRVSEVIVITRTEEAAVQRLCDRLGVRVLCPDPAPLDMKQSVQHGLRDVASRHRPREGDGWLLAPADLPTLTPELIDRVIGARAGGTRVVVPRFGGRRGHPALFAWPLATQVFTLAGDEGIDRIVAREAVVHVDLPAAAAVEDVDTPEDYRRLTSVDRGPPAHG